MTHSGVKEIEEAIAAPDRPTKHLTPINVLCIGQVIGSNIQQGTIGSSQTINLSTESFTQIKEFLVKLSQAIPDLPLNANDKTELEADVKTVKVQVESPKPKPTIIREGLSSIGSILENAVGSALGSELAKQIPLLLSQLG